MVELLEVFLVPVKSPHRDQRGDGREQKESGKKPSLNVPLQKTGEIIEHVGAERKCKAVEIRFALARAAKTATIATAASRTIEMTSIAVPLADDAPTFHKIGNMASNADRAWQAHSLGSTEDRLYPSGTVNGEAKIMFKWMSAFALAVLVCAPTLAAELEYHRQYYYQFTLPPEQHVIEVVQPPYSGNFIINGTRFTARTPACFSWAAGERIRLIAGDWNGRCVAARFYNFYRRNTCDVWCGSGGWW